MKKIIEVLDKFKDEMNDPVFKIFWDSDAKKFCIDISFHFNNVGLHTRVDPEKIQLMNFMQNKFPEWDEDLHEYDVVCDTEAPVFWKDQYDNKFYFVCFSSSVEE